MNDRGQCEQIWRNFAMSLRRSLNGLGSGGGQVVSVLAFYSDDPSLSPAEVYSFYSVNCLNRMKIKKKRPGMDHLKK